MHAGGKAVHQFGMGLEHQRDKCLLAFQRQRRLASAIERVPWQLILRRQQVRPCHDPVEIGPKPFNPAGLAFIGDMPVICIASRAPDQLILPHPRLQDRAFVLVPLVLLSLVLSPLIGPLAGWLIGLTNFVTEWVWRLLQFAASLEGLVHIAAMDTWRLVVAMLGVVLLLLPKGIVPRWLGIPMMLLLLAKPVPLESEVLRATFLDVGQGLSVLLESGSGSTLYDTGPSFGGSFSAADQIVLPALRSRDWQVLDQMIISHGDNDHAGGRQEIMDAIQVDQVIEQGACEASWERDGIWFATFGVSESGSRNDDSCVLLVVVSGRRLLLTGDIEARGEAALLSKFAMPVDVISVPHHGCESSSTPAFLNRLLPGVAVISAGYRNRFGHPHASIVRRYEKRSIRLLSTVDMGALEIILDAEGMMIREARNQASGIWRRHGSHRQAGGY
ncbi:MAG: MBL fold metallo-hydrolase [Alphaproteobacteria bacterium]|nr:MBL fold metallo-hydrolase [Alphaproteobacteria bacterium]